MVSKIDDRRAYFFAGLAFATNCVSWPALSRSGAAESFQDNEQQSYFQTNW
jgi:hypothetical protein